MKNLLKYVCITLSIIIIQSCSAEDDSEIADTETEKVGFTNETSVSDQILALVNQHRQNQGLSTLSKNTTAEELAIDHTKYMIAIDQINHDNFNQRGESLSNKENAIGIGENVARFQIDAESVVNSWLNSTGHRDNIEGNYIFTGISAIKDENGRYYYTQIFYR